MIAELINTVVQGTLLGGLYGLFAAGLSLMFGVMRFVNLAHGDFIVMAAYLALALVGVTGLHPLWMLVPVAASMAVAGYAGQRLLLNRVVGEGVLAPLIVTFGLSIIIQNLLMELYSADSRRLPAGWLDTASIPLGHGIAIGVVALIMFAASIAVLGALSWFLRATLAGKLLRATSDDSEIIGLMGADRRHLYALATALASAVVGVAGVMMAIKTNFDPASGPTRLLFAFEAVIIGGMGSLWGTLLGGVVLGLAQAIGALIDPGYQILAGHLVFLAVLMLRPSGLVRRAGGDR